MKLVMEDAPLQSGSPTLANHIGRIPLKRLLLASVAGALLVFAPLHSYADNNPTAQLDTKHKKKKGDGRDASFNYDWNFGNNDGGKNRKVDIGGGGEASGNNNGGNSGANSQSNGFDSSFSGTSGNTTLDQQSAQHHKKLDKDSSKESSFNFNFGADNDGGQGDRNLGAGGSGGGAPAGNSASGNSGTANNNSSNNNQNNNSFNNNSNNQNDNSLNNNSIDTSSQPTHKKSREKDQTSDGAFDFNFNTDNGGGSATTLPGGGGSGAAGAGGGNGGAGGGSSGFNGSNSNNGGTSFNGSNNGGGTDFNGNGNNGGGAGFNGNGNNGGGAGFDGGGNNGGGTGSNGGNNNSGAGSANQNNSNDGTNSNGGADSNNDNASFNSGDGGNSGNATFNESTNAATITIGNGDSTTNSTGFQGNTAADQQTNSTSNATNTASVQPSIVIPTFNPFQPTINKNFDLTVNLTPLNIPASNTPTQQIPDNILKDIPNAISILNQFLSPNVATKVSWLIIKNDFLFSINLCVNIFLQAVHNIYVYWQALRGEQDLFQATTGTLARLATQLQPPIADVLNDQNLTVNLVAQPGPPTIDKSEPQTFKQQNFAYVLTQLATMRDPSTFYNNYGQFCDVPTDQQGEKANIVCSMSKADPTAMLSAATLLRQDTYADEATQNHAKAIIGLAGWANPYQYMHTIDWNNLQKNNLFTNQTLNVYRSMMRSYLAYKTVGLYGLYYVYARHFPIKGTQALLANLPLLPSPPTTDISYDEIHHRMARLRAANADWNTMIATASKPVLYQIIAKELAEIKILLADEKTLDDIMGVQQAASELLMTSYLQGSLQQLRKKIIDNLLTPAQQAASQAAEQAMGGAGSYASPMTQMQKAQELQNEVNGTGCTAKVNSDDPAVNKRRQDQCTHSIESKVKHHCKRSLHAAMKCKHQKSAGEHRANEQNEKESASNVNKNADSSRGGDDDGGDDDGGDDDN